jgi:hypothetical protein
MKVEEARAAAVEVQPARTRVRPGKRVEFSARVVDQHGRPFPADVSWESVDCQVDATGTAVAPLQEGSYTVTARYQDLTGTGQLVVTGRRGRALAYPFAPLPAHGLAWQGQVPAQKWTGFYSQVLAPFATHKGLKVIVHFQVGERLSPEKVAATRAALRELGLDESGLKVIQD